MFAYERAAIDFWPGWLTESQYLEQLKHIYELTDATHAVAEYQNLKQKAFSLAKTVG